jgi:hypothetical protein
MLYQPERHEPLQAIAWDENRARHVIAEIVRDTETRFSPETLWPTHPLDAIEGHSGPDYMLYLGACGVFWALRYLEAIGATQLRRSYAPFVDPLLKPNCAAMEQSESAEFASYLMGDTGILLLSYWYDPSPATATRLEKLVAANIDHPARELMWGAPGTLLAALFMHRRTGVSVWADLYRATARRLWSQLEWSPEFECHYWTQDMYGRRFTFLDGVHGFVATATALIQGRHLLDTEEWAAWAKCIGNTIRRTAEWEGSLVNWRANLFDAPGPAGKRLVQFCHGAPGFVNCLADFPDSSLDDLLIAGGETTWQAGPLNKGSNLCHGTGGNGYVFLKLHHRFKDEKWLDRARAFAMHGIAQTETDHTKYQQGRYSLWTGDLGFAIYLWDCVHETERFPTLDVFFV